MEIPDSDPIGFGLVTAIHEGDINAIDTMLGHDPELARARIRDHMGATRTLLHVVTDWPGYFPYGPDVARLLIDVGADPNAAVTGMWHTETPLHWAASSDDSDVAVALIDGGADLEAGGASIAGGTPLDDAVGYGCWHVARLLVERGAKVDALWKAAGVGVIERVKELMAADPAPNHEEIDHAFWQACHGGQRRTAEYLLACGADINAIPDHTMSTPLDAAPGPDTRREAVIAWLREHGAKTAGELSAS